MGIEWVFDIAQTTNLLDETKSTILGAISPLAAGSKATPLTKTISGSMSHSPTRVRFGGF